MQVKEYLSVDHHLIKLLFVIPIIFSCDSQFKIMILH